MYNLFSNAIKYRDPTRPLIIQIESGQEEQFICLSFQDNGLGIDLQKFGDKIFGLYNRFHTGVVPGKGIGLNLIKTQVETLGGKIELNSKPGEGCLFKVYFPREKE
jgi:signal transduction histidine kinase